MHNARRWSEQTQLKSFFKSYESQPKEQAGKLSEKKVVKHSLKYHINAAHVRPHTRTRRDGYS